MKRWRGKRTQPATRRLSPRASETQSPEPSSVPVLEVQEAKKAFHGIVALEDVSLTLLPGEVHAVVGENGAGKSTFIKLITGAYRPDHGVITVDGKGYRQLSPTQARNLGITAIYQEFTLLPHLSVAENVFLGHQPRNRWHLLAVAERRRRVRELLDRLGVRIEPDRLVASLTVGEQQIVEIAKALALDARIVIMDEPSSVLPTHELDRLFEVVRALKRAGASVVYISHRLAEVFALADRVTVFKDGRSVRTMRVPSTSRPELVELMVGRPFSEQIPPSTSQSGATVLQVNRLCVDGCVWNVTFDLRQGEVLGLAGLGGSGRTTVTRALVGLARIEAGEIRFSGEYAPRDPGEAAKRGIILVPEDRARYGLALQQSVSFNLSLPGLRLLRRWRWMINRNRERMFVTEQIARFKIKTAGPSASADMLSGGNQQKIVLAKWLSLKPRVVILDEPTRGIDVSAKAEVYILIRELTARGVAVLVASSDLPEILGLSDRVIVLHEGQVAGELNRGEATEAAVIRLATGGQTHERDICDEPVNDAVGVRCTSRPEPGSPAVG